MRRVEARWSDVTSRVSAGKQSVTATHVITQFNTELDSLMNTIDIYDTWASNDAVSVAKDFVQLSQQLDQCRVGIRLFLKHLKSCTKCTKMNLRIIPLS